MRVAPLAVCGAGFERKRRDRDSGGQAPATIFFEEKSVWPAADHNLSKSVRRQQLRKEKQLEKAAKRVERKGMPREEEELRVPHGPQLLPEFFDDIDADETSNGRSNHWYWSRKSPASPTFMPS